MVNVGLGNSGPAISPGIGREKHRRDVLDHRQSLGHNLFNSLVEFWPLCFPSGGSVNSWDQIGLIQDLNLTGSFLLNPPTLISGLNGLASHFTAANSQVLVRPNTGILQFGGVPFCIWCWVKFDSFPQTMELVSKTDAAQDTTREYELQYNGFQNKFAFYVGNGTTLTGVLASTFGAPTTGAWYFVYGEWDAVSGKPGISINAGNLDQGSVCTGAYAGTNPFWLGAASNTPGGNPGYFLDGTFQRVGVHGRTIGADERSYLYNGGVGRSYPFV